MKTALLIALLFCTFTTKATNYYFSAAAGNDSRTPLQAQNPATPWKSLSKLNSFFTSLKPGDSALLKRDETFYGFIKITKSGTATAPIVIGSYGKGNKPVITSLVTLNGWVSKGNGIWESNEQALIPSVKIVLLNEIGQQIGRYPNSDASNKGYLVFESHSGTNSITDKEFSSASSWAGADLVVRTRRWIIDVNKVTSNSGNTISYARASDYTPYDDYGYFLQNSIKTLDKAGEWYLNPATKKLSVYFGSSNPSSNSIKIASIANIISSYNYSYVAFDNLNITGANEDGINIERGTGMTIRNCDIAYSGQNGITVMSHERVKIENCTISNSNNNGIDLGYSSDYPVVKNNKIFNTSMIAGMGQNGDGKGIGIFSCSDNSTIEYNEIRNSGYVGITYGGSDVLVKNNLVDNFCLVKDDGAGIYSHGSSNGAAILYKRRKVTGNIVMNGMGAGPGTNRPDYLCASGVYMDNDASATEIVDNTFFNCSQYGIFIHNSRGMTISNNSFYNNTKQVSMIQDADNVAIRNNSITNNIFFSKHPDQLLTSLISSANDIALFGRWDSNYYARPIDDRIAIYGQYSSGGNDVKQNFELEGWKERYDEDKSSKKSAKQIAPYRITNLASAGKVVNGTFNDPITGVSSNYCSFVRSTSGMLDGGYLQVTPDSKSSYLNVRVGGLTAGKKYILRYSVKGSAANRMGIYLKEAVSPYGTITSSQYRGVTTDRSDNELLFTCPSSESAAYVVFKADEQSKYYLDNIQLYEAEALMTTIDDSLRFEYNPTTITKSITLNGNYVDVKGNKHSNTVALQPYKSMILIKTNGGSVNAPPTVSIISPAAASFIAPASINITASANDADGSVTKVDFYNGNTLLDSDNTSPYSFTWNNVAAGTYSLTAKATDNGGLFTSSAAVTINVKAPNQAPMVSVTSPANTSFTAPASINITAAANDADGSVSKVDFYNGNILLGSDNTSPYNFTWNNIAAGTYSLTAKATDNGGLFTSSTAVTVNVKAPNQAPTVSLINPANTRFIAPASITLTAAANDADGSVTKVDFYNGNTLLGSDNTSPYSFTWNNVGAGNYNIIVKVTDNGGLFTSSTAVTINVIAPNQAPTVAVTSPANTSFTAPASINITATANDADGSVAKVDFYNGNILLGSDNTSPYSFTWNNVAAGNYSLTAKATDNGGLFTSSTMVTVNVIAPNQAPTVAVTSPANTSFTAPASINITATASDADGSVAKVDFYNGNILLGSDNTSPYNFTWNNVAAGNYSLTAKATDNGGLFTSSTMVTVNVIAPNQAPTVAVTSPANTSFTAPASINITATASDADGSVAKVDFYNGNILLGSDNTSPYNFTWNNVAAGNYSLTAKATDNGGLFTTSPAVTVNVIAPNQAPTVSITSPANSSFIAPASINITAAANDADGSVAKVDFYNGNILLGSDNTSPYSFTWNNVAAGNYALTAKAIDNGGLSTSSAAVTVAVTAPVAPTLVITSPANNAVFSTLENIEFSATAQDADGIIKRIEFFNGTTLLEIEYITPYAFSLNKLAAGTYVLTAKATDNSGLISSSSVTISVVKPNQAPTVSVTSPAANASFNSPATINITAAANDADGSVAKVEFYNGNNLLGSDNTSPYSFTWNNVGKGNYTLIAKAIDNGGLATSSSAVAVNVVYLKIAPILTITSPANNAVFTTTQSITFSALASDPDGFVKRIEFFKGTTLLEIEYYEPYSFTLSNLAPGTYTLLAKAIDNVGLITTSVVTVSVVKANQAPTVSITAPLANTGFTAPASINVSAAASDSDGLVAKVEFFNGTTLLATDSTSPYAFTWSDVPNGNYSLTARATDNGGLSASSAAVSLAVIHPNQAPAVSLTSPLTGSAFSSPVEFTITAAAADADGTVTKVEFFSGNVLLGADSTTPYAFTWSNVASGSYSLTAKATDNGGLITLSDSVLISVVIPNQAPAVSITSPVSGAGSTAPAEITITASATDADGSVVKVEFFNGNVFLAADSISPYGITWSNAAVGTHALIAKVTDNNGLVTSSDSVWVAVTNANLAPTVSITSPLGGAIIIAPLPIELTAAANDADGSVTKVEFFNGNILLATDSISPYSFSWSNVVPGNYGVSAKATDNYGLVTTSDSVTLSVINPLQNAGYASRAANTVSLKTDSAKTSQASVKQLEIVKDGYKNLSDRYAAMANIKIGPNPASSVVTVSTQGLPENAELKISVLSNSGTLLKVFTSTTLKQAIQVNISSLKAGLYIIHVSGKDFSISKPFSKQ